MTEEIKIYPDSAYPYLKRAKLYYLHENYPANLIDLKKTESFKFSSEEQLLQFYKTYLRLEQYELGIQRINDLLIIKPDHVRALKLMGRLLYLQGHYDQAILVFHEVLRKSKETFPEKFNRLAYAW